MQTNTELDKSDKRLVLLLLCLMFLFWPATVLGNGVCFVLEFVLIISIFIRKQSVIDKKVYRIVLLLILMQLLAIAFGSSYLALDLGNVLTLIISLVFVSAISFKEFAIRYVKLLYFVSCFSLVTFVLNQFVPSLFLFFPEIDATAKAVNVFFSIVPTNMGNYIRNFGAWGEPGMYGVYLILACILELFYFKNKKKNYILVFFISIISTFSTATYISALILVLVFIWHSPSFKTQNKIELLVVSVILMIFVISYALTAEGNGYVFAKLTETDSESGTTFERIRAVETAIKLLTDYFPFGCGWGVYSYYLLKEDTIMTATPINWFTVYGLVYGLIMNYALFLGVKKISLSFMQAVGITLAIYSCIISQEVSSVFISVIPILYAIKNSDITTEAEYEV